jgi:hypothetical protein
MSLREVQRVSYKADRRCVPAVLCARCGGAPCPKNEKCTDRPFLGGSTLRARSPPDVVSASSAARQTAAARKDGHVPGCQVGKHGTQRAAHVGVTICVRNGGVVSRGRSLRTSSSCICRHGAIRALDEPCVLDARNADGEGQHIWREARADGAARSVRGGRRSGGGGGKGGG